MVLFSLSNETPPTCSQVLYFIDGIEPFKLPPFSINGNWGQTSYFRPSDNRNCLWSLVHFRILIWLLRFWKNRPACSSLTGFSFWLIMTLSDQLQTESSLWFCLCSGVDTQMTDRHFHTIYTLHMNRLIFRMSQTCLSTLISI